MKKQIILGPPGTGKTTYLMDVMEQEMANGVEPEEIAFVSFTRKAANEALNRVIKRFSLVNEDFPYIRTLHSLAYHELGLRRESLLRTEHLREIGELLGLEFTERHSFFDDGPAFNSKTPGDQYLFLDGFARARQMSPQAVWDRYGSYDLNWLEFDRFVRTLNAYKKDRSLSDFADLLEARHEPLKVRVAIIDEAQDLSTLQWKFVLEKFENVERMYIAGDDDQAIYAWSGADVNYFLNMRGERIILHQSHRVPRAIHSVASEIANRIEQRIEKEYLPKDVEGEVEYHASPDHIDLSEGTWLLLARSGYMLNSLAYLVRSQGFMYSFKGEAIVNKHYLRAITIWENWRREYVIQPEDIAFVSQYTHLPIEKWENKIWHEALTKIPHSEREFYIAMLRRGEKLTKEPRININTIHGVKGGEADNVLLLTDSTFKTTEAMNLDPDAEHRVWYVAATRAKKTLHIVQPQTRIAYNF